MCAGEVRSEFRHARESSSFRQASHGLRQSGRESGASAVPDHARHVRAPCSCVQEFPGMQEKIQMAVVFQRLVERAFQNRTGKVSEAQPEQRHSELWRRRDG